MKIKTGKLFTGEISKVTEYFDIENFFDLDTLHNSSMVIDYLLKSIGVSVSEKTLRLAFSDIEILKRTCEINDIKCSSIICENGEICVTVENVHYIFDVNYLRIIEPLTEVLEEELKL